MNKKVSYVFLGLVTVAFILLVGFTQPAMAAWVPGGPVAPAVEPAKVEHPWVGFDSLKGIAGSAGAGMVSFTYKGLDLDPTQATLSIDGLGSFALQNLVCAAGVCTGEVSGLPTGAAPLYYTGKLSINDGERVCTASKLLVPPSP